MSYILQLETSTEICSVAIARDGMTICEETSSRPNSHTEELTLLIQRCLEKAGIMSSGLAAVALSDGPGSYTSLRVGAATAKGLCFACNIPLLTMSSLDILMHGINRDGFTATDYIVCMIDARREEVYMGIYDAAGHRITTPGPIILDRDNIGDTLSVKNTWHLCGNGSRKFIKYEDGKHCIYHHSGTSASYMSRPVFEAFANEKFTPHKTFSPDYFKAPNITASKKKIL
jgi:tRNA threonylcarbamoyladenosine biosynthesis protein TsaB